MTKKKEMSFFIFFLLLNRILNDEQQKLHKRRERNNKNLEKKTHINQKQPKYLKITQPLSRKTKQQKRYVGCKRS